MPECPRCGREITSLKCVRERTERYYQELRLAEGGPEYEGGWHYDGDSYERIYYTCPICSYRIARDGEGAIRFLRSGKRGKGAVAQQTPPPFLS
jgi:DNA-directed RNA polymerase subunit RPC12/RpoP